MTDQTLETTGGASAPPPSGIAGDSLAVAGWTIASRVTGFFRVAAIAAILGPTFFANLFESTNLIPNLAFELLTGPLIAALLVPQLVRFVDSSEHRAVRRLADGFLGAITIVFAVAVVVLTLAGPLVLGVLTVLVPDAGIRADQIDIGWPLLAMVMPQALFYAVASTGAAVQNAHGRFALAAAAPAVENVGIIVVLFLSAAIFGVGLEVDQITTGHLLLLGLGTTAAVGLHAGLQWWGAARVGVRMVPRAGWRDPEVRAISRLAAPSIAFAGLTSVRVLGLLVVAGILPGGVVALQLGRYFFNFPVAIGARPVTVAQLPRLSRAYNEGDESGFRSVYRNGIDLILFVTVPASLFMLALAWPLASVAAQGQMATEQGIRLAAIAIGSLALGIVGDSLFIASTSAFYARRNARSPLVAMGIRVALTAAGGVAAAMVGEGAVILGILGLGVAVADLVSGIGLHRSLQSRLPQSGTRSRSEGVATLFVATIAVGLGAVMAAVGRALTPGHALIELVIGSVTVVITYLLLQRLRRSPQLDDFAGAIRGKRHA